MPIFLKYFLAWFPMLLLAIGNGALREFVFRKYMGELPAHQLSTFSLLLLFTIYIRFVIHWIPPASARQALLIGLFWLALTLLFEFGFGRYRGNSWEKLLADYNLLEGRLWLLIPAWVATAPWIFTKYVNR
ncbi:MAG TPA: hypothetical protein PKD93_12130 [Ferruginibacter sp.]|nr:hypothetical protein [Ferruginibacter sp.]